MHDGMQYDPIQGQGQSHEPFRVRNPAIFKSYIYISAIYTKSWQLTTDSSINQSIKLEYNILIRSGQIFDI